MEEIVFPNQIRMVRRTRGKTMNEIAKCLNISLSAVSKIEKGYRRLDEKQLSTLSNFLRCSKESLFVYENTSQPEVLAAWEKELNRRKQINEQSGLKTLGAGLRYLRGEKMLTLQEVASGAGMTLSVYHRIEMGQREITEDQFEKIAHALGISAEDLQVKIYDLDSSGKLQEFKQAGGKSGIFTPKGGYNDLPLKTTSFDVSVSLPLYTLDNGQLTQQNADSTLHLPPSDLYAVQVHGSVIGGVYGQKKRVQLVVSSSEKSKNGDMVICRADSNAARLMLWNESEMLNSTVHKVLCMF